MSLLKIWFIILLLFKFAFGFLTFRYSPPLLLMQNLEPSLIDEIERHLIIAADPLLSHIICEGDFREVCNFQTNGLISFKGLSFENNILISFLQEFFKRCRKFPEVRKNCIPHLLLVLSILKRLISLDAEVRDSWTGGSKEGNIVSSILEMLKFCE